MRIQVRQEDIEQGEKNHPWCCAIARAIKRACPDATSVEVNDAFSYVDDNTYIMPNEATQFVYNFDDGLPVEAAEFELKLLAEPTP